MSQQQIEINIADTIAEVYGSWAPLDDALLKKYNLDLESVLAPFDREQKQPQCRIRMVENLHLGGESGKAFVLELFSNEKWRFSKAWRISNGLVDYKIILEISELMAYGYRTDFDFDHDNNDS